MEFAGHFGDTSSVVADGTEGVFRNDDSGGSQHTHTAQGDEVEAEGQVAATEADGCTDSDCNRDNGVHRALKTVSGT